VKPKLELTSFNFKKKTGYEGVTKKKGITPILNFIKNTYKINKEITYGSNSIVTTMFQVFS
jgi:hypothetical protein